GFSFFFVQAEDGIRDFHVTGVQTCALPISLAGDSRLPVLAVGKTRQQGYEPNAWNQALTSAGYPAESRLPAGWRNPAPAPLAPAAPAAPTAPQRIAEPATSSPAGLSPPIPEAPAGNA